MDEKVTRRTEEYVDELTGERRVRTVEYVEKLIEREVVRKKNKNKNKKEMQIFKFSSFLNQV